MTWTDWVTLAIALVGAILGLYNAWQGWQDRAVRFKVRVTQVVGLNIPTPTGVSIEVTNLSAFPITIEEVGFTVGRPKDSLPRRAILPPYSVAHGSLPMKIAPRHSATIMGWAKELSRDPFDHAFARASGGEIAYGTSPALLQWLGSLPRV